MIMVPTNIEDEDAERQLWRKSTRFSHSVAQIRELNEGLLDFLVEFSDSQAHHPYMQAGIPLGRVLKEVDPATRGRLALCPFLLLDAGFRDPLKWQTPASRNEFVLRPTLLAGPYAKALKLAQATCLLSWYLVRTDRIAAHLMLDMSPECAAAIARLGLTDLQDTAEQFVQQRWLIPRWHNRLDVWHRLIRLAQISSRKDFASVNIRGRQLLLGEDLPVKGAL